MIFLEMVGTHFGYAPLNLHGNIVALTARQPAMLVLKYRKANAEDSLVHTDATL